MTNSYPTKKPVLSIVIASQNAQSTAAECLRKIEDQRNSNIIEIIVIDNSTDETSTIVSKQFSHIKLIKAPSDKLIPELWGIGINQSCGELIALTTTHFIPANNWITEILKAHNSVYAGIGGAIENAEENNVVSWAVYFCRYSRYMNPFAKADVDDFAADNASYKRIDLERIDSATADGFWEYFVHKAMVREKMRLCLAPEIVVYHQNSFTFSGFVIQRFQHGKQYGERRTGDLSNVKRLILIILGPLIPFVFLYRITRRVLVKRTNITKYLFSLPILFLFLISWSTGEICGYLIPNKKS